MATKNSIKPTYIEKNKIFQKGPESQTKCFVSTPED
jgi:hypothetical protein